MNNRNEEDDNNLLMTIPEHQKGTLVHGSVHNNDMVEKFANKKGKQPWKCMWCNPEYAGWNAIKKLPV
jgi:hypothetical protein